LAAARRLSLAEPLFFSLAQTPLSSPLSSHRPRRSAHAHHQHHAHHLPPAPANAAALAATDTLHLYRHHHLQAVWSQRHLSAAALPTLAVRSATHQIHSSARSSFPRSSPQDPLVVASPTRSLARPPAAASSPQPSPAHSSQLSSPQARLSPSYTPTLPC